MLAALSAAVVVADLVLVRSGEKVGLDGAGIFFSPLTVGPGFFGELVMVLSPEE